ncbi:hornerin-like [Eupeodes corollae]|uniref:hornerin-like n=1 Tax=Eupeodes corollae TaxID=290404 RepID=UPI002491A8E5|nr:hornerin-like [Eupeodes corollae]
MKCFVLVAFCVQLALSLPQGYNYKDPGPVELHVVSGGGGGGGGAPCNHGPNAAGLVQQQSVGRIIHHGAGHGDSQAVTLNSHITVGDGGHSHTQSFQNGVGYVEQGRPAPIPLQQGPHLKLPGPAPSFLQNSFGSSNSFGHSGHGSSSIGGFGRGPVSSGLSGGYSGGFGGGKYSGGSGFGGSRPQFVGSPINSNFIAGGSGHGGSSGSFGSGSSYQGAGSFSSGSQFQQQSAGFSHGSSGQSFGQSGSFGGNGILNGALGNVIRETFANAPLDPTIEKHIYVHVPPEDLEEKAPRQQIQTQAAAAKKHYKIIFIKAPSVSQPVNYAQIANAGASEEKTIVYVLVKKPDEPSYQEIQQIQQSAKPSKPEVYFIKYKTRNEQQGGFIGGGYNSNVEQSSGGSQFAGSDIDGGIDVRGNGAGSSIESSHHHQEGGSFLSSGSSSSSSSVSSGSSSSFATGSGGVSIGETGPQHEVYGVPSVPSV